MAHFSHRVPIFFALFCSKFKTLFVKISYCKGIVFQSSEKRNTTLAESPTLLAVLFFLLRYM